MRSRRPIAAVLIGALVLAQAPASAQDQNGDPVEWGTGEIAAEPDRVVWGDAPTDPMADRGPIGSRWYQILASPHIGAALTHVEVDPTNPDLIFVGTEESTILRSDDGGITWSELATGPRLSTARDVPPVFLRRSTTMRLSLIPKEPFRPSSLFVTVFVSLPFIIPWADVRPDLLRVLILSPSLFTPRPRLLTRTLRNSHSTSPVEWIEVCPGNEYPLLVATREDLFGSQDNGESFVRLEGSTTGPRRAVARSGARVRHRSTRRGQIRRIYCDAQRPNFVAAGTSDGLLVSHDGGLSFQLEEQLRTRRVDALAGTEDGALLVAMGRALYRLDVDGEVEAVLRLFGTGGFRHITVDGVNLWAGTSDGLFASADSGRSWSRVAPNRLSSYDIPFVRIGRNASGGRRIVIVSRHCPGSVTRFGSNCRSTEVLVSDDDGLSWRPFFSGNTRRSVRAIDHAVADDDERWLMLTSGDLWSSSVLGRTVLGPETRAWAQQRLAETPTLESVLDDGLRRLHLQRDDLLNFDNRRRASGGLPQATFRYQIDFDSFTRASQTVPVPVNVAERSERVFWTFDFFFRWQFPRVNDNQSRSARVALWELRQRVAFLLEDAWHERRLHLERLTLGTEDLLQAEILRERILALEAVIDFWVGRDISADLSDFPEAF